MHYICITCVHVSLQVTLKGIEEIKNGGNREIYIISLTIILTEDIVEQIYDHMHSISNNDTVEWGLKMAGTTHVASFLCTICSYHVNYKPNAATFCRLSLSLSAKIIF